MKENLEQIHSIDSYNSLYELLQSEMDKEFWQQFSEDDLIFLNHCDDFDYYTYYVFNYDHVSVVEGSFVLAVYTMEEFIAETMRMLQEDREEREEIAE